MKRVRGFDTPAVRAHGLVWSARTLFRGGRDTGLVTEVANDE